MNPFYRTDIQGLRAVAVVGVILFHLSLPLPGGFLGVDAFFVISGYLIFGILWRELENSGKFSFPSFYLRRFFRLAPALALMLATTLGLLAIFTPPNSQLLKDAGDTSIGATLFLQMQLSLKSLEVTLAEPLSRMRCFTRGLNLLRNSFI